MKTTKTHCERRRTVEQAINEKMRVLKEFHIVDRENEEEIRKTLVLAVKDEPNKDYDIVLDRVAKKLITEKLI